MGVVEENIFLETIEKNVDRLKEIVKLEGELSSAILENRTDDPEQALATQFDLLMESNSLYEDTMLLLDRVVSEDNYFKANRFYRELSEFKPLVIE